MKILITGGAGFIGSALVRFLIRHTDVHVVNVDALTYSATPEALEASADSNRYVFEQADIRDAVALEQIFATHRQAMSKFASRIDRSIDGTAPSRPISSAPSPPAAARRHWSGLPAAEQEAFRFHHITTDEV